MVNNLIKAIGWSILHSLWQGAIIYAILFIVLMAWPKMSARLKHNLAFGSLFLIFTSFCFTFLSVFKIPVSSTSASTLIINKEAFLELANLGNSINFKTEAYFPLVVSIYSVGIMIQLIILLSGYLKLKKLKSASIIAVPAEWKAIFELTVSQLKINKTVKFYLSPKVNVPLVIGFFKPVVLFPIALATQLDSKQVEAILIHELSHIRRNDYLINLVKTCIETLLFFNPFVWLTTKFIHIEREHACDDLVVNFTGTPVTYAHALLKLELLKDKQSPVLSLAATGNNQHLYQRIKRITDMKTNYINAKQQFFILSLAIATVISLAWMNPEKKPVVKPKKASSLATVKPLANETKGLDEHLLAKADTDSTKRKKQYISRSNGKEIIYHSIDEMPDSLRKHFLAMEKKFNSPEWKNKMARIEKNSQELEKRFNSPEWKDKMAKIEKNSQELERKFNSPEWKDKMAAIEKNSVELEKKFNSPEWKDKMASIEKNSAELERKFNSPEWKDKMAKAEFNSKELEKRFNSPEWKAKMAKIEKNSQELEKRFNSPEWKDKMAKIEFNSKELEKKFNSPEWKDKMAAIEKNGRELERKFNSAEWKDKMERIEFNSKELERKFNSKEWKDKVEEMKKLQDSPEYKELRKKYEDDIEELKKKKGIKSDKSFLLYNGNKEMLKAFVPSNTPLKVFKTNGEEIHGINLLNKSEAANALYQNLNGPGVLMNK
ncbi:M56 family metallopeptidase [Pedobacter sp. Hv1]|uniref:M56 family metallopeptidase n=1 Tax=Pedobacter sp. Hv1 TaxID=1740090 RepID=UPI000AE596E0|nr:M56 family metallopeptidase [Pedobacter sp. Hv1]